jgi:hypothetical protein
VVQLPPLPGNLVERTYIASLTPGVEYAIFIQVVVYKVLLHIGGFWNYQTMSRMASDNDLVMKVLFDKIKL